MKTYSLILVDSKPSVNKASEFRASPDFIAEDGSRVRPCGKETESARKDIDAVGFPCIIWWEAPEALSAERDNFFGYRWLGRSTLGFPEKYTVTPVEQTGPNPD